MADANSARRIHGLMLSSNTITDSSSWPLDPIPSLNGTSNASELDSTKAGLSPRVSASLPGALSAVPV